MATILLKSFKRVVAITIFLRGKSKKSILKFNSFILLLIIPIVPWAVRSVLILIFWLLVTNGAFAQPIHMDDDYYAPCSSELGCLKGYCTLNYDILAADSSIYSCRKIAVIRSSGSGALNNYGGVDVYSSETMGKHYCWQAFYSVGFGTSYYDLQPYPGIIFSTDLGYSTTAPPYDESEICIPKQSTPAQSCNLNITSIINGAFSNKFPLDLFTGFESSVADAACPSFTITGQTFQLCYINKLTSILKYVLLLVFIISSVLAL